MNYKTPYFPVPADSSAVAKNWFAVFTAPRHEKRIETHFHLREIENFLPIYEKQSQWKDGSKRKLQLPLFSNYIFVRIGHGERVPVLRVPGVIFIVGCGLHSCAVSDEFFVFFLFYPYCLNFLSVKHIDQMSIIFNKIDS